MFYLFMLAAAAADTWLLMGASTLAGSGNVWISAAGEALGAAALIIYFLIISAVVIEVQAVFERRRKKRVKKNRSR